MGEPIDGNSEDFDLQAAPSALGGQAFDGAGSGTVFVVDGETETEPAELDAEWKTKTLNSTVPPGVPTFDLQAQIGGVAAEQLWRIHGVPEYQRRIAAGLMEPGAKVETWQMLLHLDKPPTVRLNDEVLGMAVVVSRDDVDPGTIVPDDAVIFVEEFLLHEGDHPEAGHITVMRLGDGQVTTYDFRYLGGTTTAIFDRADEFVETADAALNAGRLNAFTENAHAAAELLAKAELIPTLDNDLVTAKTHSSVSSAFNVQARDKNVDPAHAKLLNELGKMRTPGRYGTGPAPLSTERAHELMATLREFRERVDARRPRRAPVIPSDLT